MADYSKLSGVINIYKDRGFTSHDVVNIVRKTLGRIKTGHTGTLDPEARGVLPICVGKSTKLADYIGADIKEYRAELTLGITTTTEDIWGDIVEKRDVSLEDEVVFKAITSFIGECKQTPPMFSAIKVNGKKLYELAREGKEIERKTRAITIYDIKEIVKKEPLKYEFTVVCSKGTYIRSLCRDIGEKLGCGGCMSALTRTRSGNFYIEDSISLEDFKEAVARGDIEDILLKPDRVLYNIPKVVVSSEADKYLYNGNKINIKYVSDIVKDKALVYDSYGDIVGIYESVGEFIKPVTMLR